MLRHGFLVLSESSVARKLATRAPLARTMARRFVAGESVDDVISAARAINDQGMKVSVDYLGEAVKNSAMARAAADAYLHVLDRIAAEEIDAYVSLKLTQLGQDIEESFLAENVGRVLDRAREYGVFVRFDMESSAYTQRTLDFHRRVRADGYDNVGIVIQSYLYRSEEDVRTANVERTSVRLCKGAYAEPESVAFQDKREVDANFVALMRLLLAEGTAPAIATHDERMIEATKSFAHERGIPPSAFEFQMLYGVRRDIQRALVGEGYAMRVYIPFGSAWYPYLMRRLAERPANVMFLAGAVVRESPLRFLMKNDRGGDGVR